MYNVAKTKDESDIYFKNDFAFLSNRSSLAVL
jgi:hypothetical protein